jgi:DNA repair exonuclease SbcCD ATPase subunit
MKILRLKADGFGPLRGEFVFDPARLTLVVDENERGKSSLLAAIAAALYGLDRDQRSHKHVTPLDRWRPWDGGAYRVELEVEHLGERLEIRRDFTAQLVSVWDERGRERTEEFRDGKDEYPVGKRLLGLDGAEFEKCALFRHGELDRVVPAYEDLEA